MTTVTFSDIQKKYFQAAECMKDNENFIVNPVFPLSQPWLDYETLVKWSFGSSHEFLMDYSALSNKFMSTNTTSEEQTNLMSHYSKELNHKVDYLKGHLKLKFPKNLSIQEALK